MATFPARDANGDIVDLEKPLPPNRAPAINSRPVALSVEDLAALNAILAKLSADPATQATSAAILAKLIAAPATEAKQDSIIAGLVSVIAGLASVVGHVDGVEGALSTLNAKDFSTQTTLAAVLAKITADPATQTTLAAILAKIIAAPATEAKQDTGNTSLGTIAGKDFATQTTLAAILAKIIAAPSTEATLASVLAAMATAVKQDQQTTILEAIETALESDASDIIGAVSEPAGPTPSADSGLRGAFRDWQLALRYSWTSHSITTAAGSSETLLAADGTRRRILIHNPGNTSWWIHLTGGTAVENGADCIEIVPGATWTPGGVVNALTAKGIAASKLTCVTG